MTQLYTQQEKADARARKKKLWLIFGVATGVCAAVNAVIFLLFRFPQMFGIEKLASGWGMFLNIFLLTVYLWFLLFFFSIKFKLTKNFCRMLKGFDTGLREERNGIFVSFDDAKSVKDGVDCYNMKTSEAYDKRGVESERMILIEKTRPKPEFNEGDRLHYFTHANILVEYEVIPRLRTVKQATMNNE